MNKIAYTPPDLRIVDVCVESGFALSGESSVGSYAPEVSENEDY